VITYFVGHLHKIPLTRNLLVNMPHILIFIAAFWIASTVSLPGSESSPNKRPKRVNDPLPEVVPSESCHRSGDFPWRVCAIGAFSEWTSSDQVVEEDRYAARVAREYANFVYVRPFYEFHFAHALKGLWKENSFWGPHAFRKLERKAILTVDYGLESIYAGLEKLSHMTYGVEPMPGSKTCRNRCFRSIPKHVP
jgi:hypothetical protein